MMSVCDDGRAIPLTKSVLRLGEAAISILLIALLLWCQAHPSCPSWCETEGEYRVLLVGDSWAAVSWLHGSLRKAFAEMGHPSILEKGDVTAVGGSRAEQWKQPEKLDLVTRELADHPSIDCVHVFLGGNDFVNCWTTSLTLEEEQGVFKRIVDDLSVLVDHCLAQRKDVSVVLCGYDYLNFVEATAAAAVPWCATDAVREKIGNPSSRRLNEALAQLETCKASLAESNPRVFHVNNLGQMQHHFGYPSKGDCPFCTRTARKSRLAKSSRKRLITASIACT